jgi:hypothetical protein
VPNTCPMLFSTVAEVLPGLIGTVASITLVVCCGRGDHAAVGRLVAAEALPLSGDDVFVPHVGPCPVSDR